jgi:alanyl-tRNA synthetase
MTSRQTRQQYIDFFAQRHGHTIVPSSPVVPHDDPTLLFANAGMNQFKPVFLGQEKRPYTRAVNTQKCIRAGGKHNDLDDVGRSRRHHTFFEMLGNWSFGDYFKAEAIEWAWDLLTRQWGMDGSRLHVTCFQGDEKAGVPRDTEAAGLWKRIAGLSDDHVHFLGSENFWEMGETGPCGPCSEIYIDRTPGKTGGREVGGENPLVTEFWNLVFIQYNRHADGRLEPLAAKHVDTGMGLERLCRILQDKQDNYAIDLWDPYFAAIADLSGKRYTGVFPSSDVGSASEDLHNKALQTDIAIRAVADHARMASFAITDGAVPSNKKRGAVLRSVIRRAVRFGYQVLEVREPFLHKLGPVVVESMGQAFPEITASAASVSQVIRGEEEAFLSVIERGLSFFEAAAAVAGSRPGRAFSGEDIFNLHATLGFPADMTSQLARERGLTPDVGQYQKLWEEHVQVSGANRRQQTQVAVDLGAIPRTDDSPKYAAFTVQGVVAGWIRQSQAISAGRLDEDEQAGLLLDRTSFYAEQGGQVGDIGHVQTATGRFDVLAAERKGDWVVHWGQVAEGRIESGQAAQVHVDARRCDTMRNHTVTHLLNFALRKVLGEQIEQRGSLVDPEKLRFDFNHDKAMTLDQLQQAERLVNEQVYADLNVTATVMPLSQAKSIPGVRAVFGEKYPDPVRVVSVGTDDPIRQGAVSHSVEFCGGTHLSRTGQAGFFKIIAEESVSKGIRRIVAVTGLAAVQHVQKMDAAVRQVSQALSVPIEDAPRRIASLQEQIKDARKKPSLSQLDPAAAAGELLAAAPAVGGGKLVVGQIAGASDDQLRSAMDSLKKKQPSLALMLAASDGEKITFVASVSDDLIAKGLKAGDWIRETAKVAGGGGGGRPQMAQAGGRDPAKLTEALETARAVALKLLG